MTFTEEIHNGKLHFFCSECYSITCTSEEVSFKTGNEIIKTRSKKTVIDNKLTFEPHVENRYKKSRQKLHALTRIVDYMSIGKKHSIMNTFILS